MHTLTITLSDERLLKLQEKATDFGVPLEQLVQLTLETLLTQPEETFRRAMDYVLVKNQPLYQQLA
jgi:hypothetical protein